MKTFNEFTQNGEASLKVELSIDERIKSRIFAIASNGEEIAISIERGHTLHEGELLKNDDGVILEIISAKEEVSTVRAKDSLTLTKLAYHLGNRHVPLQIDKDNFLRYQVDYVLDDMVQKLGGDLTHEMAKFEPESGAYSHHHHDSDEHEHHSHEHHHHEH